MNNYKESGDTVVVAAPEAADSGEFLVSAGLSGVAVSDAENGAEVVLKRKGVFELPKTAAEAWTQGQPLYWNAGTKAFTTTAGSNQRRGVAFAAADAADTTGDVLLDGGASDGLKIASGQHTTVAASDTIVTGLSTVLSVVASYETDPADANMFVSAQIGDQAGAPAAGSVVIKTWKSADGTDPTPVAATAFAKLVNWIAIGT